MKIELEKFEGDKSIFWARKKLFLPTEKVDKENESILFYVFVALK